MWICYRYSNSRISPIFPKCIILFCLTYFLSTFRRSFSWNKLRGWRYWGYSWWPVFLVLHPIHECYLSNGPYGHSDTSSDDQVNTTRGSQTLQFYIQHVNRGGESTGWTGLPDFSLVVRREWFLAYQRTYNKQQTYSVLKYVNMLFTCTYMR